MGDGALSGLIAALSVLTRLPVRAGVGEDPGLALPWFPLVGVLVGLATAAVYAAAYQVVPPLLSAALAIAVLVVLTGALHEDGLADFADACGGGSGRDDSLRIMRDAHHGTYGVLAIVLTLVLRVGAVATLSPAFSLLALPAVHAISRTAPVLLMGVTPAARHDGQAAHFTPSATGARVAIAVGGALAMSAALLGAWVIASSAIAIGVGWFVRRAAVRRLGGLTGDVLGATQQLLECALLLLMAGVAHSSVPGA